MAELEEFLGGGGWSVNPVPQVIVGNAPNGAGIILDGPGQIPPELVAWGATKSLVFNTVFIIYLTSNTYYFVAEGTRLGLEIYLTGTYDPANTVYIQSFITGNLSAGNIIQQFGSTTFNAFKMNIFYTNLAIQYQSDVALNDASTRLMLGSLGGSTTIDATYKTRVNESGVGHHLLPRGYLDLVNVTSTTSDGPFSAETTIARWNLSANTLAGQGHLIEIQFRASSTVGTDSWQITVRRDTALTGTQIAIANFTMPGLADTRYFRWVYNAVADETPLLLFFSIVRTGGTGTITVLGAPSATVDRCFAAISDQGQTSDWRTA